MAGTSIEIRLSGISATFHHEHRGDVTAVRDLDLEVKPGEFLTLLGSSGCGKTTTLRMISGFQKPSSGRILFGGEDVTDLAANQRDIGFVFQNYALFPHLSVFENVAYGLRVKRQSAAQIESSVDGGLLQVGLQGMGERMINELSGGQQQRVALARAIAIRPRVLLFDEPLSNLDAQLRVQMRSEIVRLQKELAITTIYVTHDQEEAMAISDRIAIMDLGRRGCRQDHDRGLASSVGAFLHKPGGNRPAGRCRGSPRGAVACESRCRSRWGGGTPNLFRRQGRISGTRRRQPDSGHSMEPVPAGRVWRGPASLPETPDVECAAFGRRLSRVLRFKPPVAAWCRFLRAAS